MPELAADARFAHVERKTRETEIEVTLDLDGSGESEVATGVGFFDHMLTHVARHGLLDLTVRAKGDLHVDDHHTVEDVGIAVGQAIAQALGDRSGITRYGHAIAPMDEALVLCAVDISGRGMAFCDLTVPVERIGDFTAQMAPEFMRALAANAGITLHVRQLAGVNGHHIVEGAFKALGRALAQAVARSERVTGIPSTKGTL